MTTKRLGVALATWFGVGYVPAAPGTAGALAALALAYLFVSVGEWPTWSLALMAGALAPVGAWAAGITERETGIDDPKFVVVDEVAGQWLALSAARVDTALDWWIALALFRFFDIVKPPPIRSLERLPGGWGVMADDVGAGLCAMMILSFYRWIVGGL